MVILIMGASHTGKTMLAKRLVERTGSFCLSLDLLKMGLIRGGYTALTPEDDDQLTDYLWPAVREMIKTAVENGQDLIVEGYYFPADWKKDFSEFYRKQIAGVCLVMSERYIREHFADILAYADAAEKRGTDDPCTLDGLLRDNAAAFARAREQGTNVILIDDRYPADLADRIIRIMEDGSFHVKQKATTDPAETSDKAIN